MGKKRKNIKKVWTWILLMPCVLVIIVYLMFVIFQVWNEFLHQNIEKNADLTNSISNESHEIELIDDGLLSFKRRIDLIKNAKKSIDIEFFIYDLDISSQYFTYQLIEASKRGLNIRILVDYSVAVFKLQPIYAEVLNKAGIEVKYYNTDDMHRFVSIQHRNHRKLMVIDDQIAVTGGRNIANDYFNMGHHYNFMDSDVIITGPIVGDIKLSFERFWNSDIAKSYTTRKDQNDTNDQKMFTKLLSKSHKVESELAKVVFSNTYYYKGQCADVQYVADAPGLFSTNHVVYREIERLVEDTHSRIVAESPYFILKPEGTSLVRAITRKGVKMSVLTNSLYSTDAYYTLAAFFWSVPSLRMKNLDVYLYDGAIPKNQNLSLAAKTRWGIHSKRAVLDDKHVVIGTYNIDPRSANLNSEMLFICKNNREMAAYMTQNILSRQKNSNLLFEASKNPYSIITQNASITDKAKYYFSLPLAKIFDFLF